MTNTLSTPASRAFLWDRTSVGEPILLKAEDCLPRLVCVRGKNAGLRNQNAWNPDIEEMSLRCAQSESGSSDFILTPANQAEEGSVPVSAGKIPESTRLRQTHADLEQSCAGSSAGTGNCLLAQVVKVRAWSAPILGGGLRLTVAAPGAALLLKSLLRQPLLARGASIPQGHCCPQATQENSAEHSCQQLQHGLLTMDRTRHLISLNREAQVTAGPMPCVGIWISGISNLRDSHLWAAGMEFLMSKTVVDKAFQPDLAFLIAVFEPGVESQVSVFEANPVLHEDLSLPVWTFSARAKHAPGGAPAVIRLSQPKLAPNSMCINTGQHQHQGLLQRVLQSHKHTDTEGLDSSSGTCSTLDNHTAGQIIERQQSEEDLSGGTISERRAGTAELAPEDLTENTAAADESTARYDQSESCNKLCDDLQPRKAIAMRAFHRQLDSSAACCHVSMAEPKFDSSLEYAQMEALLHSDRQSARSTEGCEQDWQTSISCAADSDKSERHHDHLWEAPGSDEADSAPQATPRSSTPADTVLRYMRPAREASPAEEVNERSDPGYSSTDRWTRTAAAAAEGAKIMPEASELGYNIQGPSTPAGRPRKDNFKAKHDGQHPEMPSQLWQDVASLKSQLHCLKQQLHGEAHHVSSAAEQRSSADESSLDDPHHLACEQPGTEPAKHAASKQPMLEEQNQSDNHGCSLSSQADGADTWVHAGLGTSRLHGHCPGSQIADRRSMQQLSREDSVGSGMSAYSTEHLAASRQPIMRRGTAYALVEQLKLAQEPLFHCEEASYALPELDAQSKQPGQDLYICSRGALSASASSTPPSPQNPWDTLHTVQVCAASRSGHDGGQHLSRSSSLGSCCDKEMEAGTRQALQSPANWSMTDMFQSRRAACWPSFSSLLDDLSASDDEIELARLEAKYGICCS